MTFTSGEVFAMFAAYFFFSAVVSGMPAPNENNGMAYRWAFASLHILAGSIGRLAAMNLPGFSAMMGGGTGDKKDEGPRT